MSPGDVCVSLGDADAAGSYEELRKRYNASVAPETLGERDRRWRTGAYVLIGVAALLAVALLTSTGHRASARS